MRFLVLVLICSTAALDRHQLAGLQQLLKHLDDGIYPTCNLVLFSELVDYDTADHNCKNFEMGTGKTEEGNLATVNDGEKNHDLQLLLEMAYPKADYPSKWGAESWVWAGLRKVRNNGQTGGGSISKKYDPEDWEWATGESPMDFSKWFNKKQPDQAVQKKGQDGCEEERCYQNQMRINHEGKWDDTYKYKLHPYACDYQGKYILSANKVEWLNAKKQCENAGLHLATVLNKDDLDEITAAAQYFLGERDDSLREFDPENWFWIGGRDDAEEGTWRWDSTGELIDSEWIKNMPWRHPNPDDAHRVGENGQDAMAISKWGLVDDSYSHQKRKRPFACQCPGS